MSRICINCGAATKIIRDTMVMRSHVLGSVSVPNVEQEVCSFCGEQWLSLAASKAAADYVERRERARLGRLPFSEFVSAQEAADLLGVSKQAFSKNARIKRGFIYSCQLDDRTYYWRPSVLAFKAIGDGRISLGANYSEMASIKGGAIGLTTRVRAMPTQPKPIPSTPQREARGGYERVH